MTSEFCISRSSLSLILSFVLECAAGTVTILGVSAIPREPAKIITIRLHNYAAIPERALDRAQVETRRVLSQVGAELLWVSCPVSRADLERYPDCPEKGGLSTIDLNLLPHRMAELAKQPRHTLGFTPMSKDGERVTLTVVFVDLVKQYAQFADSSVSQLLAYAIAHEIGHILLRTSGHCNTGIMGAVWTAKDLQQAAQGLLFFTPQQVETMRIEVSVRCEFEQSGTVAGVSRDN